MPWKEMSIEALAKMLKINPVEVREKQKLIRRIVDERNKCELSQEELAKKVGVSQSRIAQIESGIGTAKMSFDVLLNILRILGYEYHIVSKKIA
ncbi:MAG: helix-turn-helix transcriptional regulator [Deltaproteobacteria bacterium]|nr:helix-turn-helix transcriptional regulator [Deltaproteobacteria bacterium]